MKTHHATAALIIVVLCSAPACGPRTSSSGAPHASPAAAAPRLISLAPSLTEIVFALGCGPELVGDTAYDDYPSAARVLPHVGDVRTADLERVAALHPTAVLALHDEETEGSPIEHRIHVPVVYLPNRDLRDLDADIAGVGRACGRDAQAARLRGDLDRRIATISARSLNVRSRVRVLYVLGLPGYAAGPHSFLNDMIEAAGGSNVAASADEPYPNLSAEAIVKMDPDVIIVSHDTPFDADVRSREPWRSLRAVRMGRVLRPPSDDIMERNGPRIVNGLAWLHDALVR
jgi:iron complex transport system substrate-binding protein